MKKLYCFLFFINLVQLTFAQEIFTVRIDQSKVYEGSNFAIEFTLSNGKGSNFTPPDFTPFVVVQGPQRSSQTTIINSKMESRESYRYILNAHEKGSFVIPEAHITVGKKRLSTKTIKIDVSPGLTRKDIGNKNVRDKQYFLVAKTNKDTFYNGEQITLQYFLYSKRRDVGAQLTQDPVCSSCHSQQRNVLQRHPRKVQIDGEDYYESEIFRRAFYPMRTEDIKIKPVAAIINVPVEGGRHFFKQYRRQSAVANGLDLKVLPLPNKLPKTFMGLTGQYTFDMKATRSENDAITVTIYFLGDGDANRFVIPTFPIKDGIESYEPKVIDDNSDLGEGERAYHRKSIEYTFVPTRGGKHIIEPKISYWQPDSAALVTWKGDSIVFQSNQAITLTKNGEEGFSLARIEKDSGIGFNVQKFTGHLKYVYFLIAGLMIALLVVRKRAEKQLANIPPPTHYEIFQQEITELDASSPKEHLHQTDQILSKYLQSKLGIAQSDWSIEAGVEKLEQAEMKDKFKQLYQAFYLASYAGSTPENRETLIQDAKNLAAQVEKIS